MSPYLILLPAALCLCVSATLAYSRHREAAWYLWALAGLSAFNGLLWGLGSRLCTDHRQTYSLSVVWDAVTLTAYNVLPLLAFGVRLSPTAWAGFVLVVTGAVLISNSK